MKKTLMNNSEVDSDKAFENILENAQEQNIEKTSVKKPEKTSVKNEEKTSVKTSLKILELIKLNNQITLPELSMIIGVAKRSIERNINKLQEESKLKRIGPDRGGHWEVIGKTNK